MTTTDDRNRIPDLVKIGAIQSDMSMNIHSADLF